MFPLHEVIDGQQCSCGKQCGNPGKHPRTKRGLKDATTDPEQIRRWWTTWPDAPIGIVCGTAQGLVAIDIDPRNGGDGTWARLVAEHGLPITVSVQTGGGGEHLYFRAPPQPLKSRGNALGPGVDLSAEGHYIVAPPSLHVSGKRYTFREGAGPADMDLAELPDWVVAIAEARRAKPKPKPKQAPAGNGAEGWLITAFRQAGWLGDKTATGAYSVRCPWWHEHTDGIDGPHNSTVIFPPDAGQVVGFFKCSHAHCEGRTVRDIRAALPAEAVRAADAAYPPKEKPTPEPPPGRFDPETGEVHEDRSWEQDLIRTMDESRRLVSCLPNALTIMEHDQAWAGVLVYDEFSERIVWRHAPPWHADDGVTPAGSALADEDAARLVSWLHRRWGLRIGAEMAFQAIRITSRKNSVHPVREYLLGLRWDGVQRLPTWTTTYLGAEDKPYHRAVGLRWMLSAVARIMRPGCQADSTLVLEGPQGLGKSRALRTLAGEDWFADDVGDLRSKDSAEALRGKWIIEIGELSAIRKVDQELVKLYLSRRVDHFRPAYERVTIDRPRQGVFAATTNADEYQNDPTGARRFWAVRCGAIDLAAIARDRDQLWAEAMARFQSGEQWWLTAEEIPDQILEQTLRREIDPWTDRVLEWADRRIGQFTIDDVLCECMEIEKGKAGMGESRRVGSILRSAGYETKVRGKPGFKAKVWVRGQATEGQATE